MKSITECRCCCCCYCLCFVFDGWLLFYVCRFDVHQNHDGLFFFSVYCLCADNVWICIYWVIWFSSISYVILFHFVSRFSFAERQLNVYWNRTQSNWNYSFFFLILLQSIRIHPVQNRDEKKNKIVYSFEMLVVYFVQWSSRCSCVASSVL